MGLPLIAFQIILLQLNEQNENDIKTIILSIVSIRNSGSELPVLVIGTCFCYNGLQIDARSLF